MLEWLAEEKEIMAPDKRHFAGQLCMNNISMGFNESISDSSESLSTSLLLLSMLHPHGKL